MNVVLWILRSWHLSYVCKFYKIGCDRRLALQPPWRTCDCSLVLVNSWVIVYFCKMRKIKLKFYLMDKKERRSPCWIFEIMSMLHNRKITRVPIFELNNISILNLIQELPLSIKMIHKKKHWLRANATCLSVHVRRRHLDSDKYVKRQMLVF